MILLIPIVAISGKRGEFVSGKFSFRNGKPYLTERLDFIENVKEQCAKSNTVGILDIDGFSSRSINSDIIKEVKIRGRDTILITRIETLDDVFDTLCSNFDTIAIPNHTSEKGLIHDALEISDSVMPIGFFVDGKEIESGKTKTEYISETIGIMGKVLILDADTGEMEGYDSPVTAE